MAVDEREEFESHCKKHGVYLGRHPDHLDQYQIFDTQLRWMGWQARGEHDAGKDLPAGMVKISKMIADLQSIMDRFGNTCVYIRPGVSWGAVALNRQADDNQAFKQSKETAVIELAEAKRRVEKLEKLAQVIALDPLSTWQDAAKAILANNNGG